MKPTEAIATADALKANTMNTTLKYRFLNEIEARVHGEIIMRHVHTEDQETCPTYSAPGVGDTEPDMLVPDAYAMLYVYWLCARIDEQDREWDDYNNHRTLFEAEWNNYLDGYIRDNMPLTGGTGFTI